MYRCCDELRRSSLRSTGVNGIDYLELQKGDLLVHFVTKQHVATLNAGNMRIDGGERIRHIRILEVQKEPATPDVLRVVVSEQGDFSPYTLQLVRGSDDSRPPAGFDPALAAVDFSFRIDCAADFDCRVTHVCPPETLDQPEIDYLAKDYESFRRLMLDRLAPLMPTWRDRSAADAGIALVELLAYVGDSLSYYQDAVGTEAYLNTARRRVSVRRHARLVDYPMHEGCNARAWVQIAVDDRAVQVPANTPLLTRIDGRQPRIEPDSDEHRQAIGSHPLFFEVMHDSVLFAPHNQISFYTWSDERCCLPRGAVRATLLDGADAASRLRLCVGDVLVFEEVYGPSSGHAGDANPAHRHAVRLTRVDPEAVKKIEDHKEVDRTLGAVRTDPVTGQPIVEIEWAPADQLPFPLCLWEVDTLDGRRVASHALGNIVLADHGETIAQPEDIGRVPPAVLSRRKPREGRYCDSDPIVVARPRFRPRLQRAPLTQAVPYDASAPASAQLQCPPDSAIPALRVFTPGTTWTVQRDLLDSGPRDHDLVAEIESDGTTYLRCGDGRHAARAEPGTPFTARYRVGNGVAGNVGAHAIAHVVTGARHVISVSNPLPAGGGTDPESVETVRQSAPVAFRTQQRAVTRDDYETLSAQFTGVQRAAATFRWTGSWQTAFVTVDRAAGLLVDDEFEQGLRRHLERYRLAGYDLEVDNPSPVPLEIEMYVCVKPEYFRADVKAALLDVFSSRTLADGRRGVFHPDNYSFGQTVYLSPLYAAAQNVDGVASAQITTFQRMGVPDPEPLANGKLLLGRLEIAMLANDPAFPDRGIYRLTLGGGK